MMDSEEKNCGSNGTNSEADSQPTESSEKTHRKTLKAHRNNLESDSQPIESSEKTHRNNLESDSQPNESKEKKSCSSPPKAEGSERSDERTDKSDKNSSSEGGARGKSSNFQKNENPEDKFNAFTQNLMQNLLINAKNVQMINVQGNSGNTQFGNTYNNIYHGTMPQNPKQQPTEQQPEVPKEILEDKSQVTEKIMSKVQNSHIGTAWRNLGHHLHIIEGNLQEIERKCALYGYDEMTYQLLYLWKCNCGKDATVGKLAKSLADSKLAHVAIEMVKE